MKDISYSAYVKPEVVFDNHSLYATLQKNGWHVFAKYKLLFVCLHQMKLFETF